MGLFSRFKRTNQSTENITEQKIITPHEETADKPAALPKAEIQQDIKTTVTAPEKIDIDDERDVYFEEAAMLVLEKDRASIGMLQRAFKIGFNRAARIMDQLGAAGIVGPEEGTAPRAVLVTLDEFERNLKEDRYVFNSPEDRHVEMLPEVPELSLEEMKEFISERFHRTPEFEVHIVSDLLKAGNTLIPKADYDLPLDFAEWLFMHCSPVDARLILLDGMGILKLYNGLPQLLIPVVEEPKKCSSALNWLCSEMGSRRTKYIQEGARDYPNYLAKGDNHKDPVLIVVIRELNEMMQQEDVFESFKTLLPVCDRFGIIIVAFSMYDEIPLHELSSFFKIRTGNWCRGLIGAGDAFEEAADIDVMSGVEFEKYCVSLLEGSGFTDVSMTKTSGDYGGDILAVKDQVKYVIQCKRYDSTIGLQAVQEVIASRSIYKAHVGAVMTNMTYTMPARNLAEENNIILWDRNDLIRMAGN